MPYKSSKADISKRTDDSLFFNVISRVPIFGDIPIMGLASVKAISLVAKGHWGAAAAELISGYFQAVGDTFIPVIGRDVGQELTRLLVRRYLNKEYLPERSWILEKVLTRYPNRPPRPSQAR